MLFERGWIDPSDPDCYTVEGRIDEYGNRLCETSIKSLISVQPDFLQQETLLQVYCNKLGVKADRTPVAHCEIAGEGIEYDWGHSKIVYRSRPLSEKCSKSKFIALVNEVLRDTVLTLSVCRSY